MIRKLRWWLIKRLAGRDSIAINLEITRERGLVGPKLPRRLLADGCTIERFAAGITLETP